MINPLDFPAFHGQPVTEGHVKYCAEHGHATTKVDGVDKGVCPRCGEVTMEVVFTGAAERGTQEWRSLCEQGYDALNTACRDYVDSFPYEPVGDGTYRAVHHRADGHRYVAVITDVPPFSYAEADAAVREACKDTSYDARPHSHDEVQSHVGHVTEFSNIGNHTALCCHTCLVLVAY